MSLESEWRMHEPIRESDEAKIARLESALRAHKVTIEDMERELETQHSQHQKELGDIARQLMGG